MAGKKFAAEFALRRNVSALDKILIQDSDDDVVKYAYPPQIASLSGYAYAHSVDALPSLPPNKSIGYIVGQMLYIYVGEGGDTREGRYQSVGFFVGPQGIQGEKGEQGVQGEQGVPGPKGDNGGLSFSDLDTYLTEKHYLTKGALENILAGYVSQTSLMRDYVTIGTLQEITGVKNFKQGVQFDGLAMYKSIDDTIYIDANVVVRGGITARGKNTTQSPSLFDALPIDSHTIKRDANGMLYVDAEALKVSGGLDEEQLKDYLTENQYVTRNDIPSISGVTYDAVVTALGYTPYSTTGGTVNGDIQAMRGRFVMQKNGDHSSVIPEVTALTVSTNSAGYNGYHTGIGFNALGDYGSLTYRNHIHAWVGLGGATTTAEAECYPLVFATNGNTSTGASPIERMRINPDGQVIVTGDTLLGSINLQFSDEINRYGGNLYIQHRNGDGTGHVVMCYNGGNVGIGVAYPSEKLQVLGNFLATGGITARYTSDRRLKKNIRNISASEMLMSLGGVYQFEYIDSEVEENHIYGGSHIGLIYQNVVGTALDRMCYEREDGYGSLNYLEPSFISLIAGATMENTSEIEQLKKRVKQLEART